MRIPAFILVHPGDSVIAGVLLLALTLAVVFSISRPRKAPPQNELTRVLLAAVA